jgi:hypothetical protein
MKIILKISRKNINFFTKLKKMIFVLNKKKTKPILIELKIELKILKF